MGTASSSPQESQQKCNYRERARAILESILQIHLSHLHDSVEKNQAVPLSCCAQMIPSPSVEPTETTTYVNFKSDLLQFKPLLSENFGI